MAQEHKTIIAGAVLLLGAQALNAGCTPARDEDGPPGIPGVHMAELNGDFSKLYLTNSDKDQLVVIDAKKLGDDESADALLNRAYIVSRDSGEIDYIDLRSLEIVRKKKYDVLKRVELGKHPTHVSLATDGRTLAVMDEDEGTGAVSFVDTESDEETKRLEGFFTPHFMRFSADGKHGFVANIGAHHITRVDMATLEIDGHIALDGFDGPPNEKLAPEEGGFGDAQIDADGVMFAAHNATGRVLVYDTIKGEKRADLRVGKGPWVAFAEHPFRNVPRRHFVTNNGDQTVSVIQGDGEEGAKVIGTLPGDEESYGVNFSSRAPNKAFVMNRVRKDIAVVDTSTLEIKERIPVGGNTETAATTRDGKYVVAAVSGANRVVVIDAVTNEVVKRFDNVGNYPWSVTIPLGQNYCH